MWTWPNPSLKTQIWTTPFRFLFSQNGVELVQENVFTPIGKERSTELKPKDPEQYWVLVMDTSINTTPQKEYVLFAQVMQSAGILPKVSPFIVRSIAKTLKRKPQKDEEHCLLAHKTETADLWAPWRHDVCSAEAQLSSTLCSFLAFSHPPKSDQLEH